MNLGNAWKAIKASLKSLILPDQTGVFVPELPAPEIKKSRKKHDCSRVTQHQYDFIVRARGDWERYNRLHPGNHKSLQELTDVINQHTGLNKSSRALARYWTGEINRDDLPVGQPINHY